MEDFQIERFPAVFKLLFFVFFIFQSFIIVIFLVFFVCADYFCSEKKKKLIYNPGLYFERGAESLT